MATVKIYPTSDFVVGMSISGMGEENSNHAGMDDIYAGGGEYVSAEVITGVVSSTSQAGQGWGAWAESGRGSTVWYIRRLVISFSGLHDGTHAADLAGSTVTAVSINLHGNGNNGSTGRGMALSNHYNSAPSAADSLPPPGFDAYTFGNTLITGAINMSSTDGTDTFDFNSEGITQVQDAIDASGNFTFGVMDSAVDYVYSEGDSGYIGSSEESATSGTGVYLSSFTGTSRDPHIIITYTPAATGYGHQVNGVTAANISKVNAVATADISKVNAV